MEHKWADPSKFCRLFLCAITIFILAAEDLKEDFHSKPWQAGDHHSQHRLSSSPRDLTTISSSKMRKQFVVLAVVEF